MQVRRWCSVTSKWRHFHNRELPASPFRVGSPKQGQGMLKSHPLGKCHSIISKSRALPALVHLQGKLPARKRHTKAGSAPWRHSESWRGLPALGTQLCGEGWCSQGRWKGASPASYSCTSLIHTCMQLTHLLDVWSFATVSVNWYHGWKAVEMDNMKRLSLDSTFIYASH